MNCFHLYKETSVNYKLIKFYDLVNLFICSSHVIENYREKELLIFWRFEVTVFVHVLHRCRSQWPRGLRHELFSLACTLGS
jgi:hypothetical protein